jgi:hypothetical protein
MSVVEKLEDALVRRDRLGRRGFFKGVIGASATVGALAAGLRVEDVAAAACTPAVGRVACCWLAHPYCYDYGVYGCHCESRPNYTWYCTDTNTYVYQCNECDDHPSTCCCSWYNFVGRAKDIKWDLTQFRVVPENGSVSRPLAS